MFSYPKELSFLLLLLIIIVISASDFVGDITQGSSMSHLIEEALIITFSITATIYLIGNIRSQDRELSQLKQELAISNRQLHDASEEFGEVRTQYSELIRDQFQSWNLTDSEQEIAMLLLKGLSFKEIAAIRTTREKTVRQQASQLYAKAGVKGRYAFSAWFFEDFLG
jgi:DNA-binding CsgD family transcriptional regulator|tara:strand:- start:8201 stop:8704 length:504 start_codon:yes stop_codon:yes gene_type:complete